MNLYVLFGQRKEDFPEQYAPEALEVMDQYAFDENAVWLDEKLKEREASNEFVALKIVCLDLGDGSQKNIRELLVGMPTITGTVEGEV